MSRILSTLVVLTARRGVVTSAFSFQSSSTTTPLGRRRRSFAQRFGASKSTLATNDDNKNMVMQQQQQQQIKIVQDALYRIRQVNSIPNEVRKNLISFQVDGNILGKVTPAIANLLANCHDVEGNPVFELVKNDKEQPVVETLTLAKSCGSTCEERTAAVARVTHDLREQGVVNGWRDELYPVASSFYEDPVFLMERAAVAFLGVLEYGVHINGLVEKKNDDNGNANDEIKMWIARRSATKSKYPNMLDHIVAGGQPAGLSLSDNCIKECLEEAGIPEDITRAGIRSAGAISYETYSSKYDTISRCVLFNYDLYLPESFQPTPVDGEAQEFVLWSVDQVLQSMAPDYHDPIKPNCYVVIIDWLIRTGKLSPDVPGYLNVLRELRSGDCQ